MAMTLSAFARDSLPRVTAALTLLVASFTTAEINLAGSTPAEVAIWARLSPSARADLRSDRAMWRADATIASSPPSPALPAFAARLVLTEGGVDAAAGAMAGAIAGAAAGAEAATAVCTAAVVAGIAAAAAAVAVAAIDTLGAVEARRSPEWAVMGKPRSRPAAAPATREVTTVPARMTLRIQSSFRSTA